MALLRYIIGNETKEFPLPPTIGPQRTIAILGSGEGEKALHLPGNPAILTEHAIILEAKKMSFFVLIDRSDGNTLVNGSRVTWLKALRHKDMITIGDMNSQNLTNLTFYEVECFPLSKTSECSICSRSLNAGEPIFHCPKCGHQNKTKIFCMGCFLDNRFKSCKCGYAVQPVVTNILHTAEIKKFLPTAKHERLRFEKVAAESELLKAECYSLASTEHVVSKFKIDDEVIFCPLCEAPYHRNCWVRLKHCVKHKCTCSVEDLIFKIFSQP